MNAYQSIQGWLTDAEARELQRLAAGKHALEIGSWKGRSAIAMAATAESVTCVDYFYGDKYTGTANTLPEFWVNIAPHRDKIKTVIIGNLFHVLAWLPREWGFAYFDANHDYEPTAAALQFLEHLPAVAVHDYDPAMIYEGTRRAVAESMSRTGAKLHVIDRLAVLTRD